MGLLDRFRKNKQAIDDRKTEMNLAPPDVRCPKCGGRLTLVRSDDLGIEHSGLSFRGYKCLACYPPRRR